MEGKHLQKRALKRLWRIFFLLLVHYTISRLIYYMRDPLQVFTAIVSSFKAELPFPPRPLAVWYRLQRLVRYFCFDILGQVNAPVSISKFIVWGWNGRGMIGYISYKQLNTTTTLLLLIFLTYIYLEPFLSITLSFWFIG